MAITFEKPISSIVSAILHNSMKIYYDCVQSM